MNRNRKLLTYANDPDKAVSQKPALESQTQVAVNNEGKTNEQTKGVKEPLLQGQTAPKDTKQKEQQDEINIKYRQGTTLESIR